MTLLKPPLLENEELQLFGKPDGIETACGLLVPLEVKSHRRPKFTDRLELAFYWMVLEAYRMRKAEPYGVLILPNRFGGKERHEVEIAGSHFNTVKAII
ncbi:MAG TPA: hypothetical protein VFE17_09145, partial [Candidatus Baltobacteraceae bacterium]|nr:hypothetical protein [Candidatus Baltobacteraceae bacterium]